MHDFHSMVISGGAVKVISVIGIVKYLETQSKLATINNYVGTSAGSVFSLMLVLGYTSDEMVQFLLENLYDPEINCFDAAEVFNIFSDYGVSKGNNLVLLLKRIIHNKKGVDDMEFIELAKATGKNLVVCVANLSKERAEYFSVDTTPHLSVTTAIRISCSLPFILTPLSVNGDIYVDGGIYKNFPIDYFKDNRLRDIIGINITASSYQKADNFLEYVHFLLNTLITKANTMSINDKDRNIVTVDFQEEESWISIVDLKLDFPKEKMKEYIKTGYDAIKAKFNTQTV